MINTKGFKIYRNLLSVNFCYCNGLVEINGDLTTMKEVPDCTWKYRKGDISICNMIVTMLMQQAIGQYIW